MELGANISGNFSRKGGFNEYGAMLLEVAIVLAYR